MPATVPQDYTEYFEQQDTECLRRSLVPVRGAYCPPDESPDSATVQQVTLWMQAEAVPQGLEAINIPQALIWMPLRACDAVYRASLYQQNYTPTWTVNNCTSLLNTFLDSISLLQDLFIPVEDTRNITWSPQLTDAFKFGRSVGGFLQMKSDATSTTSVALTGTFDAGYVADITQVMDLSPPKVSQFTLTRKDTYNTVPIQDGIALVQGASVPKEFQRINASHTIEEGNEVFQSILLSSSGNAAFTQVTPNLAALAADLPGFANQQLPKGIFISPWWTSSNPLNVNVVAPPCTAYDEPEMMIYVQVNSTNLGQINMMKHRISVTHVFMYERQDTATGARNVEFVTAPGGQEFHPLTPSVTGVYQEEAGYSFPGISAFNNNVAQTGNQAVLPMIIKTRAHRPGYARNTNNFQKGLPLTQTAVNTNVNCMYAFTFVAVEGTFLSNSAEAENINVNINRVDWAVPKHDAFENSAHVVQWRKVGAGQTINVNGTFWVQAPPSTLTPYQAPITGNSNAIRCTSSDLQLFLDLLYNSDRVDGFKRIWTLGEYNKICEFVGSLDWRWVLQKIASVENLELKGQLHGQAARIMSAWSPFAALKNVGESIWGGIKDVARMAPKIVETLSGVGPLISEFEHPGLKGIGNALVKYGPTAAKLAQVAATLAAEGGFVDYDDAFEYFDENDFLPGGEYNQFEDAWDEGDEEQLMADAYFAALSPNTARDLGIKSGRAKPMLISKEGMYIMTLRRAENVAKKLASLLGIRTQDVFDSLDPLHLTFGGHNFVMFPMGIDRAAMQRAMRAGRIPLANPNKEGVVRALRQASIIGSDYQYFQEAAQRLRERGDNVFNRAIQRGLTPDDATAKAQAWSQGTGRRAAYDFAAKTNAVLRNGHNNAGWNDFAHHVPQSLNALNPGVTLDSEAQTLLEQAFGTGRREGNAPASRKAVNSARARIRGRALPQGNARGLNDMMNDLQDQILAEDDIPPARRGRRL